MFYNVEPSTDLEIFKKRVAEAIKKESLKKSMADVISAKMVVSLTMGNSQFLPRHWGQSVYFHP